MGGSVKVYRMWMRIVLSVLWECECECECEWYIPETRCELFSNHTIMKLYAMHILCKLVHKVSSGVDSWFASNGAQMDKRHCNVWQTSIHWSQPSHHYNVLDISLAFRNSIHFTIFASTDTHSHIQNLDSIHWIQLYPSEEEKHEWMAFSQYHRTYHWQQKQWEFLYRVPILMSVFPIALFVH